MEWYVVGILMLVTLVAFSLMGIPLAVALGFTGFIFLATDIGPGLAANALNALIVGMWTGYTILAVPLFIFMAEFLLAGGISEDIFDMASKWFRRLPGGLAVVTIAACAGFGALSGSSLGAVATFGLLAIPQMLNRGYDKRLATGSVVAAGPLAHLIPPSILAILYSVLVETSPARQLMAGFFPGLCLAVGYVIVVFVWVRLNPKISPQEPAVSWRERFTVLRKVGAPLTIVILVLGGIYTGIATVTEAAAVGALASLVLAIASGRLTKMGFFNTVMRAVRTTSFILFIAVSGKFFGWVLNRFYIPQQIVNALTATNWNRWVVLIMFQVLG